MTSKEEQELDSAGYEPREGETERIDLEPVMPKPWVVFQDENVLACYVCKTYQLLDTTRVLEISEVQSALNKFAEMHRPCLNTIARGEKPQASRARFPARLEEALQAAAILYIEYSEHRHRKSDSHVFEHPRLGQFEISFRRAGVPKRPEAILHAKPGERTAVAALRDRIKALLPAVRYGLKYIDESNLSWRLLNHYKKLLAKERKLQREEAGHPAKAPRKRGRK